VTTGDFGVLLRTHRQQAGLTQRGLAEQAGMSAAAIRDLEQGRTRSPKRDSVQAIATVLGLGPADVERLHMAADAHRPHRTATRPADGGSLRIRVLGPTEVWHGDVRAAFRSDLQRTLLTRLAVDPSTTVGHDELIALLWEHDPPASAVSLLRTYVARLRRLLAAGTHSPQVLVAGPTGYRLVVGVEHLDLLRFRDLVARAAHADPHAALNSLAEAVALWRGETDVDRLATGPAYTVIVNEYAAAVRTFAALARDLGEPERALRSLRDLTAWFELDEPMHVELILTLAAAGRQAEALAGYDRIRSALADQLGVDPGERLRAAHLAVLRQQGDTHQVIIQQAPAAPSDFVGRGTELDRITAVLTEPDSADRPTQSRTVLVSGIAGIGKTALVLAAAHRLRAAYPDGQLYVDLRGTSTTPVQPMQVLGRFLRALGVPGRRIGTDESEAAAVFRSVLANRRVLVMLDNAHDVTQVRPLLPGAGRSDVLVTSRRRLPELAGATVLDLTPLALDESISLIAATAGAHQLETDPASATALAEACARLPLALRIASARLATRQGWTIGDLARRLRDDNHRLAELSAGESSVLASFQLSYADLNDGAQRAFRLCGLHPGDDFGADGTGVLMKIPPHEADQVLEHLLEANMLMQHTADRYRFHDLLGLYARRLLATDAEGESARWRLYSWYAEAVTAAMEWVYPQLVRLETHPARERFFETKAAALDWLDVEAPALLALVRHTATDRNSALAWRITDQLRGYFLIRRQVDGWLPAAEAGMTAATEAGDDVARTAMLISRSQALDAAGRNEESLADCLAGEQLAVASGWTTAAAYLSHDIGWLYRDRGKFADADHWLTRALELTGGAENVHDHVRAVALNGLSVVRLDQGQFREAAELLRAALEINEATGRTGSALVNRGNLASALRQLGDTQHADELLTAVLAGYRGWSNLRGELSTLDEMSLLRGQQGRTAEALELAQQAYDLAVLVHDKQAQAKTSATVAEAFLGTGNPATAGKCFDRCLTIARRHNYPYQEARALVGLARTHLAMGDQAAARAAAEDAASIAGSCGFQALENQVDVVLASTPTALPAS
jgi:DNA-binding SARP family transcriptional activator